MKALSPMVTTVLTAALFAALISPNAAGKPLKIYVMAGQSNMQGQARVRTIERFLLTGGDKQMYADMKMKDGLPSAVKDAYGVYFGAGDMKRGKPRELTVKKGPLRPGLSDELTGNTTFGPEYTFGIYMQKHLNEPILIIKCAWGGRDLLTQFRPPSGGKYKTDKGKHGNPIGYYYNAIIKHVKSVLADPGKYHPGYKKADGYEIAGFVWFQGFNDMIGPYPGSKKNKDYSEYSRLLACFIRDVRKDLNTPKMPFVIGVMGLHGVQKDNSFRKAQAAPAALPEFQGNVAAVWTGQYWDMELARIIQKTGGGKKKKKKKKEQDAPSNLTPEEAKILKVGKSNAGYHYMGSALTYGRIGRAFAAAMAEMTK